LYRIGIKRISLTVIKPSITIYYSLFLYSLFSQKTFLVFMRVGSVKTGNENYEYFLLLRRASKIRPPGVY